MQLVTQQSYAKQAGIRPSRAKNVKLICDVCKKRVPSYVYIHELGYDEDEGSGYRDREGPAICGNCILHALKVHDGEAQS